MKAKIIQLIKQADSNPILVHTGNNREDLRSAYEMALICSDLGIDNKEQPIAMFERTGRFLFELISVLSAIGECCYENNIEDGARGSITAGEIEYLTKDDALDAFNIVESIYHAERIKDVLCLALIDWSKKQIMKNPDCDCEKCDNRKKVED